MSHSGPFTAAARPAPTRRRLWALPALAGLLMAGLPAWTAAPASPASVPASASETAKAASASTPALPASGTASAPAAAETQAVQPAGVISSIALPPGPACRAPVKPPCVDPHPLSLERLPETLPRGRQGIAYLRVIQAEGGQAPYVYTVVDGQPPAGLELTPQGLLQGTPTQVQRSRFVVMVRDAVGRQAQQAYLLQVLPAPQKSAPAASAARPASSPTPLQQVDLKQVAGSGLPRPDMIVYQLQPAQLDELKTIYTPSESAPAPAADGAAPGSGTAAGTTAATTAGTPAGNPAEQPTPAAPPMDWSEAQQTQLQHWLAPVMGVEYPSRALFLAAVNALACDQVESLLNIESQRTGRPRVKPAPGARTCEQRLTEARQRAEAPEKAAASGGAVPPKTPATAAPPAAAASAAKGGAGMPTDALPEWLLPGPLAVWLAKAAAQPRVLDPLPRAAPAASAAWKADAGCDCVNVRERQTLYAIAPTWQPGIDAEPLDYSLIHRLTAFGFSLPQLLQRKATPPGEDPDLKQRLAFIETARRHDTRIDLGIYHQDWRFLDDSLPQQRERYVQRLLDDVPHQARLWLDAPLPGFAARWKAYLPGFGSVQRLGDGLTLYFDNTPSDEQSAAFRNFGEFYPQFVKHMADAMGESPQRSYSLNLLINLEQIKTGGAMSVARLFELLKAVEKPQEVNGRIVETSSDSYQRGSNVVLRFLVFLPEPSSDSKKQLRRLIEESPALKGADRRIFLRSVVPLLVLPQRNPQQYEDDVVYVQDNFDGIGFWPAPLIDSQISAEQRHTLRRVFVTDPPSSLSEAVCGVVCPNRWALRLLLELLLLAGLLTWVAFQWNCEWRAKYGRLALLAGIPPVIVGAALLQCDPALAGIRNSNAQLVTLIAIPVIAALAALLKRKVEKP